MKYLYLPLILTVILITQTNAQILTLSGIVAYYPVTSLPGNTFRDLVNDYDGSISSGTTFTGDRFGSLTGAALTGNAGTSKHLQINTDYTISGINTLSGFSLALWVKPLATMAGGSMQIASFFSGDLRGYDLIWNGGTNTLKVYNYTTLSSINIAIESIEKLKANEWQLLTLVADPTQKQLQLYLNDKLIASTTTSVAFVNPTSKALYIGKNMQPTPLMAIDDVQLYGRALNAPEVKKLYYNCVNTIASPIIVDNNKFICTEGPATFEFYGGKRFNIYASINSPTILSSITTDGIYLQSKRGYTTIVNASPSSIWVTIVDNNCESDRVEASVRISNEKLEYVIKDTVYQFYASPVKYFKKLTFIDNANVDVNNLDVYLCPTIPYYKNCSGINCCSRSGLKGGDGPGMTSGSGSLFIEEIDQKELLLVIFKGFSFKDCQAKPDTLLLTTRGPYTSVDPNQYSNTFKLLNNPVNNIIQLKAKSNSAITLMNVKMVNSFGMTFQLPYLITDGDLEISTKSLYPGFYILILQYEETIIQRIKILKE